MGFSSFNLRFFETLLRSSNFLQDDWSFQRSPAVRSESLKCYFLNLRHDALILCKWFWTCARHKRMLQRGREILALCDVTMDRDVTAWLWPKRSIGGCSLPFTRCNFIALFPSLLPSFLPAFLPSCLPSLFLSIFLSFFLSFPFIFPLCRHLSSWRGQRVSRKNLCQVKLRPVPDECC